MVAVLYETPAASAVAVIVRISEAPGAIEGTAQTPPVGETAGVCVNVPLWGEAETNVTLAGRLSVTSTPVAVAVPLLVSVTV